MVAYSRDYLEHIAHKVRDARGRVVGWRMPQGGVFREALLDRPPFKRLAGKYAALSGRGRRRSQAPEAVADRCELVAEAWRMRVTQGATIRQIAAAVDRSPSLVGRWLRGIPAMGGTSLARLEHEVWALTQWSERLRSYDKDDRPAV